MNKVDLFFELLSAVYGRSKMESQWPTDRDMQIARALCADKVNGMDVSEIRDAIDNARRNKANEVDGWGWPDIDLVLAGSKRFASASHRLFLPEPERNIIPAQERSSMAKSLLQELFK